MRGALILSFHSFGQGRIIPADAGSTMIFRAICSSRPDHPRGCGEHVLGVRLPLLVVGSSPRMRGALGQVQPGDGWPRIIPADAGSTWPVIVPSA